MAKIPEEYNIGNNTDLTPEKLLKILTDMYRDLAIAINKKPDLYERTTDGLATDTSLSDGSININKTTTKVQMLTNHTSTTNVTWVTLS